MSMPPSTPTVSSSSPTAASSPTGATGAGRRESDVLGAIVNGIVARRLRLALTVLAVMLGVMLVAGTYVYTDTINRSFDRIFAAATRGTDASITPNDDVKLDIGQAPAMPAALLRRIQRVPGVARAEGDIFDQ